MPRDDPRVRTKSSHSAHSLNHASELLVVPDGDATRSIRSLLGGIRLGGAGTCCILALKQRAAVLLVGDLAHLAMALEFETTLVIRAMLHITET